MEEVIVQWLPWSKTIPAGWKTSEDGLPPCHHNHFSRLIERDEDEGCGDLQEGGGPGLWGSP